MRRTPLPAVLVAFMLVVPVVAASCGTHAPGNSQLPAAGQETPAAPPEAPGASVIGPAGGSVSTSDRTSVTVPAGALAGAQSVTITPSPASPGPARAALVGPQYVFGPEGVTFSKPVTVTLAFDPARIPAGKSASDVKVYTAPVGSTAFTTLPTTPVDATHVAAQTTHFSRFGTDVPGDDASVGGCASSRPGTPPACSEGSGGTKDIRAVCWGNYMQLPCTCSGDQATQPMKDGSHCFSACVLDKPQCPVLQEIDRSIMEIYNLAALPSPAKMSPIAGMLTLGLPAGVQSKTFSQLSWVHWLAAKFYFNNDHISHYAIKMEVPPGESPGGTWGAFFPGVSEPGASSNACSPEPVMYIDPLAFSQASPVTLLVVLGHETIHYLQNERTLPPGPGGKVPTIKKFNAQTQKVVADIRELEAYAWELGDKGSTYGSYFQGSSKNKARGCMDDHSIDEDHKFQTCYKADAKLHLWYAIHNGFDAQTNLPELKTFLESDPYGQIWANDNPGWQDVGRGAAPPAPAADCGLKVTIFD
jgi:hypothetical protein